MKDLWTTCFVPITTGFFFGIINYAGLWITVRNVPFARRPAIIGVGSYFFRSAVVLGGFYLVMDGRWERLVLCMAAFLSVRYFFLRIFSLEGKELRILMKGN